MDRLDILRSKPLWPLVVGGAILLLVGSPHVFELSAFRLVTALAVSGVFLFASHWLLRIALGGGAYGLFSAIELSMLGIGRGWEFLGISISLIVNAVILGMLLPYDPEDARWYHILAGAFICPAVLVLGLILGVLIFKM